jgi:homoserine kinase type II
MAVYTQLKKPEIVKILKEYDLKLKSFRPEKGGASNSNYLLKTNRGKFMLTIAEEQTKKEVKQWAKRLRWLAKHQFKTPLSIQTKTGKLVSNFQGKPVIIKEYLSGYSLTNAKRKHYVEIGAGLAKLNAVPLPEFMINRMVFDSPVYQSVIGKNIDPYYEQWLKSRLEFFKKNMPKKLPKGLVHNDLFLDNVLFENDHFKTILDFEDASDFYFIFDVGMAIIGLCFKNEKLKLKRAKAFLEGYQSIRKLKQQEIKHLQFFTEYGAVLMSTWRAWKYHIDAPNHERAWKHQEMMRMAKHIQKMKPKKFLKKLNLE